MKTYSYADLQGKLKVGDIVSADPTMQNFCNQLKNDGSNTQKITKIDEDYLWINGCSHSLSDDGYLRHHSEEKTLDNLERGDVLVDPSGNECTVLDVRADGTLIDTTKGGNSFKYGFTRHVQEFKDALWTVKGAEPDKVQKAKKIVENAGYRVTK